tara:strand:+ start:145 stop:837 length:693 start_codon:yes stop_codon:yes gene_type:complete
MPKANKFTALGKGNGFNRCLSSQTVSADEIINAPTFEQVVGAYWNFHSVSFSGASFEPENEPSDLICTEGAAFGFDTDGSFGPPSESFLVSNGAPGIVRIDGNDKMIYYRHGIGFRYSTFGGGAENIQKFTSVYYTSTVAIDVEPIPYSCTVVNNTTSGGTTYSIGKSASQRTVDVSSVDIDGLPFVKTVIKDFSGISFDDPVGSGNAVCEPASFLPETSETPSLTFWDY